MVLNALLLSKLELLVPAVLAVVCGAEVLYTAREDAGDGPY